ncbi:hypothetical protein [Aureibacter tunicatorum]|uniref:Lipoprotein n=1 Tax=Aureibacter tunicatorum TaxID=866807 RepID=A0AAE3XM77_9BACT|nr:hypothetical protein [Aureibacter tunicatorum]MDR6238568.1 hypothetical protein [Aureibacter tunicatorum]BDD05501.1 hypothetical protein AUTU_29840 [Aureibacter tunicatorum]
MKKLKLIFILSIILTISGCFPFEFKEQANRQFGDQHFKTAIALIELHKLREGEYPEELDSLNYIGGWDQIAFNSVKYKKLDGGYELNLTNGWLGKPEDISYPDDFWKGLGLIKSN